MKLPSNAHNREACRRYRSRHPDRRKASQAKYRATHVEKVRAGHTADYAANKDREARSMRRRRYGLSQDQYDALLTKQNGRCAICKVTPEKGLQVDHCHSLGHVRGLLCGPCNRAIGLMKDNPTALLAAAAYVSDNKV
jgi:Recombination endonuclease VII